MKASELLVEFYDLSNDKQNVSKSDAARRPRLTMKHLTKLRKLRDIKAVDQADHNVFVSTMYTEPGQEGEM